ncbi:MAG: hypothetical protein H0W81_07485 [Chloroflexi bacterium]|nr:hypothetical protein [Chloroflexota bacterium]
MTQRPEKTASCLACDLISGASPLPGGSILRTHHWAVEHCIGPLGVGSLVVKPLRHVVHFADLEIGEVAEIGPLLHQAAQAVTELTKAEQVYVCLWSHANRQPGHIHFVVQPVSADDMRRFDAHGPALQLAMFESSDLPAVEDVEQFARRASSWFAHHSATQL